MGEKLKFSSIPGVVGEIQDNGMEIIMKGSNLETVKKYLTAHNKGASYQLAMAHKRRTFDEAGEAKRKEDIARLQDNLVKEYWAELPDGSLSVPIGFWYLCENISGHTNTTIPYKNMPDWLRPYQKEDISAVMKYNRGVMYAATGLGKTKCLITIACLSVQVGKRVCIIVPTVDLVRQTIDSFKEMGITNVSGAGGSYHYVPGCDVLVTTIDSAYKFIDCFQVVTVDECLPYETEIATEGNSVKIGTLYARQESNLPLPLVKTFNEQTKEFEYKKIIRVIKQRDRNTLKKITFSKVKVCSTDEHPFLTTKGWKKAEELEVGDLCVGTYDESAGYSMAGRVLNDDLNQIAMGIILGDGSGVEELARCCPACGQRDDCEHKLLGRALVKIELQKERIDDLEIALRDIANGSYTAEGCEEVARKSLDFNNFSSLDERGLAIWYMDDGSLKGKQVVLHTESFSYEEHLQIVSILQSKFNLAFDIHMTTKKDGRSFYYLSTKGENGPAFLRRIAPYMHQSMQYKNTFTVGGYKWNAKYEQFGTYKITKIEDIEYKRKKSEGFGLFDLEVSGNHNFCVSQSGNKSSVVVHNCHHSAASTWFALLASAINATHVYAVSATPYRTDGMDVGIHAWCGPIVTERTAAWGIANGWLARPDIYMVQISDLPYVSSKSLSATAYKKLAHHPKVQGFLLKKIQSGLTAGRIIMVIFNTVKAGESFKKFCKGKLDFDVAHADFRKPFHDFKAGKTQLLVGNVKLFGEGVDVPRTDCIITLCNNSSEIITRQVIGRAMRISKNKKDAVVLDLWFDNYEPYVRARNNRVDAYSTVVDKIKEICI